MSDKYLSNHHQPASVCADEKRLRNRVSALERLLAEARTRFSELEREMTEPMWRTATERRALITASKIDEALKT